MSTVDPFTPGGALLHYRLGERAGGSVWQAEDTRNGRKVAIKILSRQLPRDPARRDAMVKDVQLHAAIYHTNIATILEVMPAGDMLVMIMEWIEGQPVFKQFANNPADKKNFFRFAIQAADAVKFLHTKNLIHSNLNGDAFMVTPTGQVKLVGLNVTNMLQKGGGPAGTYQQKGSDVRCASYMSPEQISSPQPLPPTTDIWSLGVVFYEVATGRLPFNAATGPEVARKIYDDQPQSPKSVNPAIDASVLTVVGKCLFKDPFKRYKDLKAVIEDINKLDPEAAKFAGDLLRTSTSSTTPAAATETTRNAILFLAEIANYDELAKTSPMIAKENASRMQQLLGESVYLFDGEVIDPFGPRMIAELKSVDSALEAARKGEFDFSAEQQTGEPIPVRLLLHGGPVETKDGAIVGPAVTKGLEVLSQLQPLQLYISEDFVKHGRGNVRLRDVGAKAGVKLFEISATEPKIEMRREPTKEELLAESAARAEEEAVIAAAAAAVAKKKKQKQMQMIGGIAAAAVIAIVLAVMMRSNKYAAPVAAAVSTAPKGPAPATAATPRPVFVQPIAVEGTDPALADRAKAIRLASMEVLRSYPEVKIADGATPDAVAVASTLRAGAAGAELSFGGGAAAAPDAASGIQSLVQFVSTQLKLPQRNGTTPDAYNAFADAVLANDAKDNAKAETSLRASLKADPNFLPAQMLALRFFTGLGKDADALAAAKQIASLDPSNVDAARIVARAGLRSGDLAAAITNYGAILKKDNHDVEAINVLGHYALSVNDVQRFGAVITKAKARGIDQNTVSIHEPDVLLAAGRIDGAADKYYEIETKVPDNAALSLKLGRISVLRHGSSIAEAEMQKLQKTDPRFGLHVLKAYLLAQAGAKDAAVNEMKAAQDASMPGDEYYTYMAEVEALGGDPKGTLDALTQAVKRKEPTAAYIMASPLFAFLANDAQYNKLRESLVAQQGEVKAALANVSL